ncbi:hypothetical protein PG997_000208 [Apiospora hydei]|uniref:Uncharacterized protein n=1 Tax=Apiospora hydei TaxID=1337664 RepID=A0ABR1XA90_9PEZI
MWQPPQMEEGSRKVVKIHHKLVKSSEQLERALPKFLKPGERSYFEMRNDFYIIQIYKPKASNDEPVQQPKLDVVSEDAMGFRL